MNSEQIKTAAVYNELKKKILAGEIKMGEQLPDTTQLRKKYNISYRSAKEVTLRLRDEGFVTLSSKNPPVVTFGTNSSAVSGAILRILENRELIIEAYKTIACLTPSLIVSYSHRYGLSQMPHYAAASRAANRGASTKDWRAFYLLCQDLIKKSDNAIASEMFTSLVKYGCFSYFFEEDKIFFDRFLLEENDFLDVLEIKDLIKREASLRRAYEHMAESVSLSLNNLLEKYPNVEPKNEEFEFSPGGSGAVKYTPAVLDIITKITSGIYKADAPLPPLEELSEQYNLP